MFINELISVIHEGNMIEAARQSDWLDLEIGICHLLGLHDMRALQKISFYHQSIRILNQILILTTSLFLLFGNSSN